MPNMKRILFGLILLLLPLGLFAQSGVGGGGQTNVSGGGSSTGPISPSQLPAGVPNVNVLSAVNFGIPGNDSHHVTDATFTSGSGNVVISATDPPFNNSVYNATTNPAGDIGKSCFGGSYTGGTGTYVAYVLRMNLGTIDTVTDATH